jgi:hypothetical protein
MYKSIKLFLYIYFSLLFIFIVITVSNFILNSQNDYILKSNIYSLNIIINNYNFSFNSNDFYQRRIFFDDNSYMLYPASIDNGQLNFIYKKHQ